jgi:hypothetical protein
MSSVTEVSKLIRLDLSRIPSDKIADAKKEVGDYLIEEILRHVGDGKSPVQGERWKSLSKEYADENKGGNRTPTMQLYGDLLDSLKAEDVGRDAIKIGHFGRQAPKADGHNQHSVEAKLWATSREFPKRRYIPEGSQKFKSNIERGINDILDGYRESEDVIARRERIEAGNISEASEGIGEITADRISVGINDFFSDDVIEALIAEAQRRRR